jgi:hypothetical protein
MTKRVVEHEIKLEKSVKVILGVSALGVLLNTFALIFYVTKAFTESIDRSICVYQGGSWDVDCNDCK